MEEARKRRASFELIRREQRRALHEKKKAPDSDKENHGAGIISLLHDSAGKGDPQTRSDKQGGLNVSSLSKEDAIKTVPLLPTPTTSPLKPLGFANGLPQKTLQIQSFNTSQNSEIQQFNTEDIMESSICAQRFSGGRILGSVHVDTLSPKQMPPFSHSKFGPFHMRPGTVVECDYPTFSGSSKEGLEIHLPEEDTLFSVKDFSYTQNTDHGSAAEGANFDEEGSEICLPEEDALFLVNDFLCTQNTDQWSAAEWDRAEGLPPKDEAADMNSRFQSLDVSGSHSHDHIDRNNLYHLSKNKPNAELPKRNARTMLLPSDRNRQAPFEMPKATHNGAYFPSPQDMKSMQGVRPAPGGPCAGPAAAHHILLHMTMPGSFLPPQAFPICAPHMFYDRTHMTGANSFHVRRCQPGYGETGIMMTGPPAPGLEGYHAEAFDRPVQAERRGRSMQVHPELAGDVHGFHRHFRR
ncbi:unnamed protein product [Alopecurus aequalis]